MGEALTLEGLSTWRARMLERSGFSCTPIDFDQSDQWFFENGRLRHKTGGFFSVIGMRTEANDPRLDGLEVVILDQRKPAIIGLIAVRDGETNRFLFQGRIEPGNIGGLQFAPTVQSTQANYKRLHGGGPTAFVDIFLNDEFPAVTDEMQSEEGSRYFAKYNRTIVKVVAPELIGAIPDSFKLLSLGDLKGLLCEDNWINTDARSVLACADWAVLSAPRRPFDDGSAVGSLLRHSYDRRWDTKTFRDVSRRIAAWRARANVSHCTLALSDLRQWHVERNQIIDKDGRSGFSVRQFKIVASEREVRGWDQPLVDSETVGQVALVGQERDGVIRFLIRAGHEVGLRDGVAFTASLSVAPGHTIQASGLDAWVIAQANDGAASVIGKLRQSEEGGRFYQDENEYIVSLIPAGRRTPDDEEALWLTLGEIKELVDTDGCCAIELRCVLSLMLKYI